LVVVPGAVCPLHAVDSIVSLQSQEEAFDGIRILSLVHHCIDIDRFVCDAVIDEERKNPGDHPMKTAELSMVTMMKEQRFNVRAEGIQEVITYARFLAFVEKVAVEEILLGVGKDLDPHAMRSLNSFLT
jgi:hypothetical protein